MPRPPCEEAEGLPAEDAVVDSVSGSVVPHVLESLHKAAARKQINIMSRYNLNLVSCHLFVKCRYIQIRTNMSPQFQICYVIN